MLFFTPLELGVWIRHRDSLLLIYFLAVDESPVLREYKPSRDFPSDMAKIPLVIKYYFAGDDRRKATMRSGPVLQRDYTFYSVTKWAEK